VATWRASSASSPEFWAAVQAAGPLAGPVSFDPLTVDDVLAAEREVAQYDRRRAFVADYAWAVPTQAAIQLLVDIIGTRRTLEVCAGTGLWARLLSNAGVSIVATDWAERIDAPWYQIEHLEAEAAVKRHADCDALLLCWPPYREDCAYRALQAFTGDRVIHIGDTRFTAEQRFYDLLTADWRRLHELALPSWPGSTDAVTIYERTKRPE
jgi:hypothetical protein